MPHHRRLLITGALTGVALFSGAAPAAATTHDAREPDCDRVGDVEDIDWGLLTPTAPAVPASARQV
ncbi:hypothetical protein [Nesterenkonia sp. PF2B19]|uniref:hypothetical protein n=1 Tax=Nesterenkonia sp. PF2B19 TaxID=1881858 RepID=UPI00087255FE|nr:hypothetical protein [Nesterenkonia sp. PF2B19]OSM42521.1 hypothetical protein BCY76_013935 [Nesterenkonia sp. PF2B19]